MSYLHALILPHVNVTLFRRTYPEQRHGIASARWEVRHQKILGFHHFHGNSRTLQHRVCELQYSGNNDRGSARIESQPNLTNTITEDHVPSALIRPGILMGHVKNGRGASCVFSSRLKHNDHLQRPHQTLPRPIRSAQASTRRASQVSFTFHVGKRGAEVVVGKIAPRERGLMITSLIDSLGGGARRYTTSSEGG